MVRDALVTVFISNGAFQKTNLPAQCVIMDTIPRNAMGKVDVHAAQSSGKGARFTVSPVRKDGDLVDVRLSRSSDSMILQAGLPDELDQVEMTYAQMLLWFIPGAHAWYTTGNTEQKRKVLEKGVTIMQQFAQQMNPPQVPQGPAPLPVMPFVPIFPSFQPAPAQQGPAPQAGMPFGPQGTVPQAGMPFGPQGPVPQVGMPQFQMPPFPSMSFAPQDQSAQQAMPQFQMPFVAQGPTAQQTMPQVPTFCMPAAQGQQATMPFVPVFPYPQAPNAQTPQQAPGAQQQAMPVPPFAMPYFGQPAPNAPNPAQQGVQTPFGPAPQPYEVYENALKNAIAFLQNLLAQSEAAREAAEPKADSQSEQSEHSDGDNEQATDDAQPAAPTAFMPGFGCQQVPMPTQHAPGVGMQPTNNYLGSILGSLFGAANTDYFYED
jgi:hypothetical protein